MASIPDMKETVLHQALNAHDQQKSPFESDHSNKSLNEDIEELKKVNKLHSSASDAAQQQGWLAVIKNLIARIVNAVRRLFSLPPVSPYSQEVARVDAQGDGPALHTNSFAPDSKSSKTSSSGPASNPKSGFVGGNASDQSAGDQSKPKMSLDVLDEVPEDQDFPEPDLMNLHDDSSIGPEAVLDLAQAEHSGTAQRPEDLEKIEFEEDQVQISLFSKQSPIAAALTQQKDGSLQLKSSYEGAGEDPEMVQIIQRALAGLDAQMNAIFADENMEDLKGDTTKFLEKIDIGPLRSELNSCENALVNGMASCIVNGENLNEDNSRSISRAIILGLPKMGLDTIKATLTRKEDQEKAAGFLQTHKPQIQEFLVQRSSVNAFDAFSKSLPLEQQGILDKETVRVAPIDTPAQLALLSEDRLTNISGRLTTNDLIALEESSELSFNEDGTIGTPSRPSV